MLMALLYNEKDVIVAGAYACDQIPYGETYWKEIFPGRLRWSSEFQTAYTEVNERELQQILLELSIQRTPSSLATREIESRIDVKPAMRRAA
jgi:hypothetical protein